MIELLQKFSLSEILIYSILLALAIKALVTFFDWVYERIKKVFHFGYSKISQKEQLEKRLQHGSEIMATLQQNQKETGSLLFDLCAKIDMLIDSDKDSIKAYITREHHYFCYDKKWIDDFNLDCLERRYQHYTDQGGNSFIEGFMEQLRALPKVPPRQEKQGE